MIKANIFKLCDKYKFSDTYHIHLLGPEDRVTSSPLNQLAIYEEDLHIDLYFLLHSILNIFDLYQIIPTQLTPNSFHILVSFIILCQFFEIQPRVSLFHAFFKLKRHPKVRGWWFLGPHHGHTFLHGLPSSIHNWKNKFFFITSNHEGFIGFGES